MEMSRKSSCLSLLIGPALGICATFGAGPATASRVPFQVDRQVQQTSSRVEKVKGLFTEWDRAGAPGCAVGAIEGDDLVFTGAFGLANVESGVPITAATVFDLASASKQFTAMAILLLEAEGKLSLESPVRDFVPELPTYREGDPIRIRHLLHHTSGLRDYLGMMQFMAINKIEDSLTEEEAFELIVRQPELYRRPGDKYTYTNTGYFLLSMIVERVSGLSLPAFAARHIFEPLGMTQTRYLDDVTDIVPQRARGYRPTSEGFKLEEMNMTEVGPGGVLSSVNDLLLWDRNFYEPKVGSHDLIRKMVTPGRLNDGSTVRVDDGSNGEYAAGLFVREYRGFTIREHEGAVQGFNSNIVRFTEQHFTVVVLCNRKAINPIRISRAVADIFLEGEFPETSAVGPSVDSTGEEEPVVSLQPADPDLAVLRDVVGEYYHIYSDAVIEMALFDGRLTASLRSPGADPIALDVQTEGARIFRVDGSSELRSVTFHPATATMAKHLGVESHNGNLRRFVAAPPLSSDERREIEGRYYSSEVFTTYVVTADGRHLRVTRGEWPHRVVFSDLVRIAPDRFLRGGQTGIEFERNAANSVTGLRVFSERDIQLRFQKISTSDDGGSGG